MNASDRAGDAGAAPRRSHAAVQGNPLAAPLLRTRPGDDGIVLRAADEASAGTNFDDGSRERASPSGPANQGEAPEAGHVFEAAYQTGLREPPRSIATSIRDASELSMGGHRADGAYLLSKLDSLEHAAAPDAWAAQQRSTACSPTRH